MMQETRIFLYVHSPFLPCHLWLRLRPNRPEDETKHRHLIRKNGQQMKKWNNWESVTIETEITPHKRILGISRLGCMSTTSCCKWTKQLRKQSAPRANTRPQGSSSPLAAMQFMGTRRKSPGRVSSTFEWVTCSWKKRVLHYLVSFPRTHRLPNCSLHACTLPPLTDSVSIHRNVSTQLWMGFQLKSTLQTFLRRHREADVSSCDWHAAAIMTTILRLQNAEDVKKQWPVFWFEENVVFLAGSPLGGRGQKKHMWEHFWLVPSTKPAWTELQCSL